MKSSRKPITAMNRTPTQTIIVWSENANPGRMCATSQPTRADNDDGEAPHRRRPLLVHVVLGTVVLLAEDRLALPAGPEERDQPPRAEERDDHRRAAGQHDRDHDPSSSSSRVGDHGPVVEVDHAVAQVLGPFVALAGHDEDVARSERGECGGDRGAAIRLDADVDVGVVHPPEDVTDDVQSGSSLPRVVRSDDHTVGETARHRTHLGTLLTITVTTGPEHDHDDRPRVGDRPRRPENLGQSVGGVGVVDDHGEPDGRSQPAPPRTDLGSG